MADQQPAEPGDGPSDLTPAQPAEPVQANPMVDLPQPEWEVVFKGSEPFDENTIYRGDDS